MSTPQQQPQAGIATNARTNSLAIVTFVLSLSAWSIAGIITGHIALKQLKTSGESGLGLAKAGLIISYVTVGLGILFFLLYAGILFAAFAGLGALS